MTAKPAPPRVGYVKDKPYLHVVEDTDDGEQARCGAGRIAVSVPGRLTARTDNGCRLCAAATQRDPVASPAAPACQ